MKNTWAWKGTGSTATDVGDGDGAGVGKSVVEMHAVVDTNGTVTASLFVYPRRLHGVDVYEATAALGDVGVGELYGP